MYNNGENMSTVMSQLTRSLPSSNFELSLVSISARLADAQRLSLFSPSTPSLCFATSKRTSHAKNAVYSLMTSADVRGILEVMPSLHVLDAHLRHPRLCLTDSCLFFPSVLLQARRSTFFFDLGESHDP